MANLLSDGEGLSQQSVFSFDFAIGHDSAVNYDVVDTVIHEVKELSPSQVSASQIHEADSRMEKFCSGQPGFSKVDLNQVGFSQISFFQNSLSQNSTLEVGFTQVRATQIGGSDSSTSQINPAQVSLPKATERQVSRDHISSSQTNIGKLDFRQIDFSQVGTTKISFPRSIPFQQFFSSHNSNLQNTTIIPWTNFSTDSISFDLNLESTALPTGQLAEAQLTRFDTDGCPIAGTILIDDDANGLGWFIDPTPWESGTRSIGTKRIAKPSSLVDK